MEVGIKETKELQAALGELAFSAGQIYKDKKVGLDDLQYLIALGVKFPALAEGFKGIDQVKAELSNLKQEEVVELLLGFYSAVNKFAEGKKS